MERYSGCDRLLSAVGVRSIDVLWWLLDLAQTASQPIGCTFVRGDVAELADALDLGSSSLRSAGSNPVIPISLRWPVDLAFRSWRDDHLVNGFTRSGHRLGTSK